jgi:hypothetical protein
MTDAEAALIAAAQREIEAGMAALGRGLIRLQQALEGGIKLGVNAPDCIVPITDHRRQHRTGVPSKIASDPDLQAFVGARIDRLTFSAIAADVAAHFPPDRCVSSTSIHRWWRKQNARPPLINGQR